MTLYTYRALDKQGEIIQDKLEGSGEMAVAHELRQQGLLVIDVKEQSVGQKDILEPFKRIKLADLSCGRSTSSPNRPRTPSSRTSSSPCARTWKQAAPSPKFSRSNPRSFPASTSRW